MFLNPSKGQITTVELSTVMKSLGQQQASDEDLKEMIGENLFLHLCIVSQQLCLSSAGKMDKDNNGYIDLQEFLKFCAQSFG